MGGLYTDIDADLARSAGLDYVQNTDEQRTKAVRAIAGSDACRGAGDAEELLEALDLLEFVKGRKK